MIRWTGLGTGIAVSLILLSAAAPGENKSVNCAKNATGSSERVEGQIAKVDADQGTVSVRTSNGATYEFHASKETLQGYKVGDHIAATRRSDPNCPAAAS